MAQTDPAGDKEDEDSGKDGDSRASIVGFWRTIFTSTAGTVVDVGYDQFHPDGMENAVDNLAPSFGDVCLGVWEKTGPGRRHYLDVHPNFNWDANGIVISILLEKLDVIVSRDGTTFVGKFTWDSYDFQGNLLPQEHVEGVLTGDRITVRGKLPFPFPF